MSYNTISAPAGKPLIPSIDTGIPRREQNYHFFEERMNTEPLLSMTATKGEKEDFFDDPIFEKETHADSPMIGSIQILINTAIGSGTLMVPYCYTTGMGLALLISALFCVIGFASLSFMVLASHWTKTYDYYGLFASTFGEKRVWIVQTMIFLVQFGSCMIYCHWNGRLVPLMIGKENDTGILGNHIFWIFILAACCVFPLVCLKSIKTLENISYLSSACVILLIVHSAYWFFRSVAENTFAPQFEEKVVWFKFSPIIITCLSVNSMAFNCHMNLFPTLEHQRNATFRVGVHLSAWVMGLAFIMYNLFGIFTYLYLYDNLGKGSALEAYPYPNILTKITTGGIVFVMILSVPIVIWAARISVNMMFFKNEPTTLRWIVIGGILTLGAAGLAATSDNVIMFFDIVGGLFTPSLIFLLPSLFYLMNQKGEPFWRILAACIVAVFTVIATIACTYQAVSEAIHTFRGDE